MDNAGEPHYGDYRPDAGGRGSGRTGPGDVRAMPREPPAEQRPRTWQHNTHRCFDDIDGLTARQYDGASSGGRETAAAAVEPHS